MTKAQARRKFERMLSKALDESLAELRRKREQAVPKPFSKAALRRFGAALKRLSDQTKRELVLIHPSIHGMDDGSRPVPTRRTKKGGRGVAPARRK